MQNKRPRQRGAMIDLLESRQLFAVTAPTGFVAEPWGGRITDLSSLNFAPDGRLFALSQPGDVYVIKANGQQVAAPALHLDGIAHEAEQGLSGIAFDPNFATEPWIYLYYTKTLTSTTFANEIARFKVVGDAIDASSKQVLMTLDTVTNAIHNAGAMTFGPDGKLYIGVGDGAVGANAQSVTVRQGKILRINKDGTIPSDNPTSFVVHPISDAKSSVVTPTGVYKSIWAVGLRNPFSLDFDSTGRLIIGDVGQEDWEELNLGKAGANYGWPTTRDGRFDSTQYPEFTQPIYEYAHGTGTTLGAALVGVTAYHNNGGANQFGSAYEGKVFFADFNAPGWINTIDPSAPPADNGATFFAGGLLGTADLAEGPDGSLYVTQRWNDSPGVIRIRPNTAIPPSIVRQPVAQLALVGAPATFSVGAIGQAPITYQWFRDGVAISGANADTYTIPSPALADDNAMFSVKVSNSLGTVTSVAAKLDVSTDTAPVATILSPAVTVLASGGVKIDLLGSGTDAEDGTLAGSSLTWKVDYYTGGLQRPYVSAFTGNSGSFTPHTVTPYLDVDVFYRVTLTATDSNGRTSTVTRDVQPLVTTTTLRTNPAVAPLALNGAAITSPYSFASVAGVQRELSAPDTFIKSGQTFQFVSWSDGGARVHTLSAPATNTTITANYVNLTPIAVTSIVVDTSAAAWKATVTFSAAVLDSVDRYDFGLSGPTSGYIGLPDAPIVFDRVNNKATIQLTTAALPNGNYTLNVYPAGITDAAGIALGAAASQAFIYPGATPTPTPTPTPTSATLSGRVFVDANNDGIAQTTELGKTGVTVWLDTNDDGTITNGEASTTTDASGNYGFAGLDAGAYPVRVTVPVGYTKTTAAGGGARTVIAAGQTAVTAAAIGLYLPAVASNSRIAGVVFTDVDRSGFREANETGRASAVVYLDANGNGTLDAGERSATADAGGYYEFSNVPIGTYQVRPVVGANVQTTQVATGYVGATIDAQDQYKFMGDIGLAAAAAPSLPTPVALGAEPTQPYLVHLSWQSATSNVLGFVIERRAADGQWAVINDVVTAGSASYNDWSVQRGVTYVYRIRSKGAVGTSVASNELTVKAL